MGFNDRFSPRGIDSIPGNNGQVLTKVNGEWAAETPAGGGGGAGGLSQVYLGIGETNLSGAGTIATPLVLLPNLNVTSVTASAGFKGSGAQLTNLTASNIQNFTVDVRSQLSAGSNMQYSGGAFALSANPSVTSVTASAGFSGSQLTTTEVNTDFIDFAATSNAAVPHSVGRLSYNSDLENLQFDLPYDTTTLNIGKQLLLKVTNNTAAPIAKGKVVRVDGSAGSSDTMYAVTASWEDDANSANTIGFLASDLAVGETGYAVLSGMLYGVDTSTYSAGVMLYLSSSGNFTTTLPTPPRHTVRLGHIARVQSQNGSIFVRVQNGYELEELHDVLIASPQNYDLLVRDTDGLWKNTKTLAGNYTFSGNNQFTGSLSGTATNAISSSYAANALSSSFATNADTLDGFDNTAFPRLAANNTFTGTNTFGSLTGSSAYFANNVRINGTASIALLETVNQTSLQVGEKYIILMSGSTDHVGLDGSGLLWGSGSVNDPTQGPEGENAYIKYRADNDQLEIFPGLRVSGSISSSVAVSASTYYGDGSNLTGIAAGVNTNQAYTWTARQTFNAGTTFGTGSIRVPYSAKTSSYNLSLTDYIVSYSGSNLTGSLPDAGDAGTGTTLIVKNLHTSSLVISASAGDLIDGASTTTIYGQYSSYSFVSDGGTNWFIV